MSASNWTKKVFRLRGLPGDISSSQDAANLLGESLGLLPDDITVYSLAKTHDKWQPMSKVATVQFKSIPPILDLETTSSEWTFAIRGVNEALILDSHFEGMTVLNDVETKKHRADCIAISGLASHPFGSWQPHGPDKNFMWIRDELPRLVPGVRAVLYGYNSRLIGSNSFQSISDIARSLILDLKPGGWNLPTSKPIIFLAHSLGGIVLKEAIVQMADSTDKSVAGILYNLLGAIMFGVPSLGMEQSYLMAMVEGQANQTLVQDLSRNSNYVRRLDEAFNGLSFRHMVKIYWAYETEESPTVVKLLDGSWSKNGPSAILVNPESATCHYYRNDKSLTIPINKDHSNMVKFSRGNNDLRKIIFSLNDLLNEQMDQAFLVANDPFQGQQALLEGHMNYRSAGEGVLAEDIELLLDLGSILSSIQEIHDDLYFPKLDARITEIEDPFQSTFKWIFDLKLFTHWLQEGSGLFWINGKPGSGKSTLMKYIFQSSWTEDLLHDWRKSSLDIKAGFFFHFRGNAMQKSFEGLLRSLIIQILQPYRTAFQKQHQKTWESFQLFKKEYQMLERQRKSVEYALDAIMKLTSSERDLKEQLQHVVESDGGVEEKKQTIRDIEQKLRGIYREKEEVSKRFTGIKESESELQLRLNKLQAGITVVSQSISSLAKEARPFQKQPATELLRSIVAEFHSPQSKKLERILRQLLYQDKVETDLVLFFDALDEFDGHLDKVIGFLKSLVEKPDKSSTRVKVCFSSRPWEKLKDHFDSCPGFGVQDCTKADIEQYATGSLACLGANNLSEVVKIVPSIIARANGVFLWVKLAVRELSGIAKSPGEDLFGKLEKKLEELPTDLSEFYTHIIERISEANRRYTFALLELLARQAETPATATDVWGAVLTSGCTTFQESLHALRSQSVTRCNREQKVANDIATWGGGLVEIKAQDHIQLMHQTVLEFTMDLRFKRIVLGNVAAILKENGHSFYFKYWVAKVSLGRDIMGSDTGLWIAAAKSLDLSFEEKEERKLAAYHAEKSESTTGISQLEFIETVPISHLQRLLCMWILINDKNTALLALASSYGLMLCIRAWIARNPYELQRISLQRQPPLLASIAFEQASGVLHEGQLAIARLLLENGYSIAKDAEFFPRLLEKIWDVEARAVGNESDAQAAIVPAMQKLATLVLDHGQDPSIYTAVPGMYPKTCTPLHLAPPGLAAELIRCKADVNMLDSDKMTPLDWVLEPPSWTRHWSLARRYEMCCLLVNAGGLMSTSTPAEAWTDALDKFDNEGYDTRDLQNKDPYPHHNAKTPLGATRSPPTSTQPPATSPPFSVPNKADPTAQDSERRRRLRWLSLRILKKKK
ncbi:hypothetical protein MKX08_002746 [Trichoderma sp. CBMAI-0020]|nr:hypothetical protein MKX08_002746 [Trichoderma sp. CBMAI-0020]